MRLNDILVMAPASIGVYNHTRALQKCGYRVSCLDFIPLIRQAGFRQAERQIEDAVAARKPDALFLTLRGDSFQFPIEFFMRLKKKTKLVLWLFDDEIYFDSHFKYYAQAADVVVTTDRFALQRYVQMGTPAVLSYGCLFKDIYRPVSKVQDIDVSFVGNCDKADRAEYIRHLEANNVRVEAFGQGSKNGHVDDEALAEIYARSRINLNFSKLDALNWVNQDEPIIDRIRGNKAHPIEVSFSKGFCLTEYYPSLPHIFEIGPEIDYFCDKDSLLGKVRHYLANAEQRDAMAERAHRKAVENYGYDTNLPVIMREIEALLLDPAATGCAPPAFVRQNDAFKRKRINVLVVYLMSAVERGSIASVLEILPMLFQYGFTNAVLGIRDGLARVVSLYRNRTQ